MKVYRFYKKPENEGDTRYDLYALTNNNDYASNFMSIRDMNKFILRVTKEDKETYAKFANDNLNVLLDKYKIVTRDIDNFGLIQHKYIDMIMTSYEYQSINGDEFQCEVTGYTGWWDSAIDYRIFNNKIKNALRILEYIPMFKLYRNSGPHHLDEEDDDYSSFNLWIDELGAFIQTFNETFK